MSKSLTKHARLTKEEMQEIFRRLDAGELKFCNVPQAVKELVGVAKESTVVLVREKYFEERFPEAVLNGIFEKLDSKELKFYKVSGVVTGIRGGVADENISMWVKRKYLERRYGIDLSGTSENVDVSKTSHDGAAVGVYGSLILKYSGEIPVRLQLLDLQMGPVWKVYPVFMMINEGKVAAGIARGITALENATVLLPQNGGLTAVVKRVGMSRDILLELDSLLDANRLRTYVESEAGQRFLKEQYDRLSGPNGHNKLLKIDVDTRGNMVHLIYWAETGAAMGLNAVTKAATFVTRGMNLGEREELRRQLKDDNELERRTPVSLFSKVTERTEVANTPIISGAVRILMQSGNEDTDKKQSATNMIRGRGVSVETEVVLPIEVVKERFFDKTDLSPLEAAELLVKATRAKNEQGSLFAVSLSANSSVANPLGGLFPSFGQDIAQIVESSQAVMIFNLSNDKRNLVVHGSFQVMETGTHGGETGWGLQAQLLKAAKLNGDEDHVGTTKQELAAFFASVATIYEINILATLSNAEVGGTKDFRIRKE